MSAVLIAVDRVDAVLRRYEPGPEERRRVSGWSPEPARRHVAARGLLRELLGRGGLDPRSRIAAAPGGRPYLPDTPAAGISLSHDGDTVAAAVVSGRDVGIDVQCPRPVAEAMLGRCCTPEARARLAALSEEDRATEFAWIWTAQEACVKAEGTGLAGGPWRIPVGFRQPAGEWRGSAWTALRGRYEVPVSVAVRDRD